MITDYEYRIDQRGDPWISIGSTDTTHTVTGLVNGTTYVFQVRALNRIGRSGPSLPTEATPIAQVVLDLAHFANGAGIISEVVLVNVAPHPIQPALYFYDQEGEPIAAESMVDVLGDLGIQEDGAADDPDGNGAAGRTHDLDPRPGRPGEWIGEGGRLWGHRRGLAF